MPTYSFSLIISPPTLEEEAAADRLYAAGCDDALFSVSGGIYEVEFDREASTLKEAVESGIGDVYRAEIGARVLRVVPDDLVNASTIAERSGKTRQAVRFWIRGERGKDFPPPRAKVGESPVWSWASVAEWLRLRGEVDADAVEDAVALAEINQVLELDSRSPAAQAGKPRRGGTAHRPRG